MTRHHLCDRSCIDGRGRLGDGLHRHRRDPAVGIWRCGDGSRRAPDASRTPRGVSIARTWPNRYGLRRPSVSCRPTLRICWPRAECCGRGCCCRLHAREWSDDRIRVVLCHELRTCRRHDWLVQITAEVRSDRFWFNPLIWIACTRLRRDSEQACDDAVLGQHVPAREYAGLLLDLARKCRTQHRLGLGGADGSSVNARKENRRHAQSRNQSDNTFAPILVVTCRCARASPCRRQRFAPLRTAPPR